MPDLARQEGKAAFDRGTNGSLVDCLGTAGAAPTCDNTLAKNSNSMKRMVATRSVELKRVETKEHILTESSGTCTLT